MAVAVAVMSGLVRVWLSQCLKVVSATSIMTSNGLSYLIVGLFLFHPTTYAADPNAKFAILSGIESTLSYLLLLIATKVSRSTT